MCVDFMLYEKKAYELQDSDHSPRRDIGKKEGLMNLILQHWKNMGYQYLNVRLRISTLHMGCVDNLFIDKATQADANKNKKKLSCLWVDMKKAFDNVSHSWLLAVNRDHGINKTLTSFIESIIRKWKTTLFVPTTEGLITIGPIDIKRVIICKVTLFVLYCSL